MSKGGIFGPERGWARGAFWPWPPLGYPLFWNSPYVLALGNKPPDAYIHGTRILVSQGLHRIQLKGHFFDLLLAELKPNTHKPYKVRQDCIYKVQKGSFVPLKILNLGRKFSLFLCQNYVCIYMCVCVCSVARGNWIQHPFGISGMLLISETTMHVYMYMPSLPSCLFGVIHIFELLENNHPLPQPQVRKVPLHVFHLYNTALHATGIR